ncbi:hypothetical protein REPUB_Repub17cG0137800 [Reevesia pubescens]
MFHAMQRILSADSSSESSFIFSGSDASSCSTASTNDSSRSEDLSDYLFGEMRLEWYNQYGISPYTGATSSSYHCFDADSRVEIGGRTLWLERDGNSTFLYADSRKQRRNSSSRASDFEHGVHEYLFLYARMFISVSKFSFVVRTLPPYF